MKTRLMFTLCNYIYLEQHPPLVLQSPPCGELQITMLRTSAPAIRGNFYDDDALPSKNDEHSAI